MSLLKGALLLGEVSLHNSNLENVVLEASFMRDGEEPIRDVLVRIMCALYEGGKINKRDVWF